MLVLRVDALSESEGARMFVRIPSLVSVVLFTFSFSAAQTLPDSRAMPAINAATRSLETPKPTLPTIVKHVDEVNLLLSVTNRRGRFVQNLDASDLIISDNGEPPDKITFFQRQTDLPLRVALVIDVSGSVTNRFAFEQRAAQAFLQGILRPER